MRFPLMNLPDDGCISYALKNIINTYSLPQLRAALVMRDNGLESTSCMILVHLDNLELTYGYSVLSDVLKLFGITDYKTIDFNIDDKVG